MPLKISVYPFLRFENFFYSLISTFHNLYRRIITFKFLFYHTF